MEKTHRKCDTCKNEYRVTREARPCVGEERVRLRLVQSTKGKS
jgi:hypothetical protein